MFFRRWPGGRVKGRVGEGEIGRVGEREKGRESG